MYTFANTHKIDADSEAESILIRARAEADAEIIRAEGHKQAELLRAEASRDAATMLETSEVAVALEKMCASACATQEHGRVLLWTGTKKPRQTHHEGPRDCCSCACQAHEAQ